MTLGRIKTEAVSNSYSSPTYPPTHPLHLPTPPTHLLSIGAVESRPRENNGTLGLTVHPPTHPLHLSTHPKKRPTHPPTLYRGS